MYTAGIDGVGIYLEHMISREEGKLCEARAPSAKLMCRGSIAEKVGKAGLGDG